MWGERRGYGIGVALLLAGITILSSALQMWFVEVRATKVRVVCATSLLHGDRPSRKDCSSLSPQILCASQAEDQWPLVPAGDVCPLP